MKYGVKQMSEHSDTIQKMFYERDEEHHERTLEILEMVAPNLLKGVITFMKIEELVEQNQLIWDSIELINQIISLRGRLKQPVGSSFITESGKSVEVTDETQEYFTQALWITIPFLTAVNGSADDVVDFLENAQEKKEELEKIKVKEDKTEPLELLLPENEMVGFDLEKLTEQQWQQLELYYKGRMYSEQNIASRKKH